MKKIVTVALCIIMAFALAGCGKTKTPAVLPAHNLLKEKAEQENADCSAPTAFSVRASC